MRVILFIFSCFSMSDNIINSSPIHFANDRILSFICVLSVLWIFILFSICWVSFKYELKSICILMRLFSRGSIRLFLVHFVKELLCSSFLFCTVIRNQKLCLSMNNIKLVTSKLKIHYLHVLLLLGIGMFSCEDSFITSSMSEIWMD